MVIKQRLEAMGHTILSPYKVEGVDYWSEDGSTRIKAKKELGLIKRHMDKIKNSDAILVVNPPKKDIQNYIGSNTFLEIGFAHYHGKKIFVLNKLPDQPYIREELMSMDPILLEGDISKISSFEV